MIAALEVLLEALREGSEPELPVAGPTSRTAGRACPDHLRELVYRARAWRCTVPGCRTVVEGPPPREIGERK